MLYMIFGGSGSGKSEFAENLAARICPGRKIYLATLTDIDEEMKQRIADHRAMREGKNFATVERGYALQELDLTGERFVLLECMTNLLANELYTPQAIEMQKEKNLTPAAYIMEGIEKLCSQVEHVMVIAGDAFAEVPMDKEFRRYVKESGSVNQMLAKKADMVVEVKFGLPLVLKGKEIYEAL